ncbi:MAG: TolC family protein [Verrucomicrobiales bacterium]
MPRLSTSTRWSAFLIAAISASLCGSAAVRADDEVSLSREEAVRLAFRNNRELGIAALEVERAASRLRWSGRLDNPELELSASSDAVGLGDDESTYEVAFSQRFPLTSKLRREKDVRRHQVILAEAEVAERRRELAGKVDLAVVELLATRERIRLQRQLAELNREILEFLRDQVKRGEVSALEVTQATLNGRTMEQQVASLLARETQQRLALNQTIGVDATTAVNIKGSPRLPESPPPTEANLREILSRRPDHVLALAKIDEAEAGVALEEAKRWEDVSVRFFVEGENAVDDPGGLERNTFAGVGISIPLPLRRRNQEGIDRARIDREAAGRGVDSVQFEIRSEAEEAYRQRRDAWDLAREASGDILGLAEQNLEEFRKAYQEGQASLLQVQRAQEQILEVRDAAIGFATDYHRADARVRFVTGDYPGLVVSSVPPK